MNIAVIVGRLGGDPEQKTTQSGTTFTKLRVAAGKDDKTIWYGVSVFGKSGEYAYNYGSKGREVVIVGRLETREHEGKTYHDVIASEITYVGGVKEGAKAVAQEDEFDPFA